VCERERGDREKRERERERERKEREREGEEREGGEREREKREREKRERERVRCHKHKTMAGETLIEKKFLTKNFRFPQIFLPIRIRKLLSEDNKTIQRPLLPINSHEAENVKCHRSLKSFQMFADIFRNLFFILLTNAMQSIFDF
jgi:hypothetical protein